MDIQALGDCCMGAGLFHLTLAMLRLNGDEGIEEATRLIEDLRDELQELLDKREDNRKGIPCYKKTFKTYLHFHASLFLSFYPCVYLPLHPSVRPSVCSSVCPSIHLSIHLSVRPSIHPSICLSREY